MVDRDIRDIGGGLAMTATGLFAAWFANGNYEIGELNRMGPGYFPVALGLILAALGALIALPAMFRRGEKIHVEWKTFLVVTLSVALFAGLLKVIGLILATVVAVIVSSLADKEIAWRTRLITAAGVAFVTWLVFSFGLSMVLPVWPWSN
ncbi:MAG: tripartite tricarboxylate transporter TctB family protein [Gammaproteobacteria bacterium]